MLRKQSQEVIFLRNALNRIESSVFTPTKTTRKQQHHQRLEGGVEDDEEGTTLLEHLARAGDDGVNPAPQTDTGSTTEACFDQLHAALVGALDEAARRVVTESCPARLCADAAPGPK
ncbi:hypothetical protein DQ04_04621010 [Trypanosoma grayi]|uniref:hypothetical protein n=1 Tax=Trypanosoma grayi TaxID=71804 RepID=UPI0004F48E90|nr:hypothetical protein DQ04_04621010 [Trypanosoma grayi]KEG09796.1 hypothetical protein DQ04_04621010 [Trypanosoma grayi]